MSLAAAPLVRDWLGVEGDRAVIRTGKVDFGQRITTALLRIACEELTLPPDRIRVAPVRTGAAPDEGITSGSNSVEQSGHALRCATATAREAAAALAAQELGLDPARLTLADGVFAAPGGANRIDLLPLIARLNPALAVNASAPASPRRAHDAPLAPRGLRAMVEGRYAFLQDLDMPGMWHARVVRPPHALARLKSLDPEAVTAVEETGQRVIRDGSFLAVAGPAEWPVLRASLRLARGCDWDLGEGLPEGSPFDRLDTDPAISLPVAPGGKPEKGSLPPPLDSFTHRLRVERPNTLHGSLGPSAALTVWEEDVLRITTHSQGIYPLRDSIADSLGLDPDTVEITHHPAAGCYGHNGADDAAFEAALVARALPGTPILLKWAREDEHAWEPAAPAMAIDLAARVKGGQITGWSGEARGDTHRGRPRPGPDRAGPQRLLANRFRIDPMAPYSGQPNMNRHGGLHRNLDPIYDFASRRLVKHLVPDGPIRSSALRCLGAVANVWAIESLVDQIAGETLQDPIAFRLAHLDDPRAITVLEGLRDSLGPAPEGRGIAYAQYKNAQTRCAIAVDLTVTDHAELRLDRIAIVADAGRIVDEDGLRAQLEGGALQGASWALYEEVRWDRDGMLTRDWDSYPVIRFDNIPEIAITLIDRPEDPSVGAGEASPPPTVAAIANAVHAATGLRLTRMPFTPDALQKAALEA
ncbi:MAG: molybdopterin-dependent oxidoreductase [Rhodobacteraceae bacterium]|nr:molybdopterin-dependent oxidoreductase [Paracoccaceae bacterium]